ncbi:MAG TPA: hypothetical protein VK476_00265 [Flavobacterium sp.]|nr:hypothetical protein [Flavobacterium sp.]
MKTLILGMAAFLFSINIQAQNQQVKSEQKTTTTTVKDSDGSKTSVKKENVQEVQNIELQNANSNELNKDIQASPVEVTSTTRVTNPDGSTRTVDRDRSSYYSYNGRKYKVALDAAGYRMMSDDSKRTGLLRKTSTNSYIYRSNGQTSIGYFDTNGNLILETYDDKSDKVSTQTYAPVK